MSCCNQIKPKLHNNINKKEREQRAKILYKYSNNLTSSLYGIVTSIIKNNKSNSNIKIV